MSNGASWGRIILTGAVVTGTLLVAPTVLTHIGMFAGAANLTEVGSALIGIAHTLSSAIAGIGGAIGIDALADSHAVHELMGTGGISGTGMWDGVGDILKQTGEQIMQADTPFAYGAIAAGTLGAGATAYEALKKSQPSGNAPGGMSYAEYVEMRRRMAAAAPPTRTA